MTNPYIVFQATLGTFPGTGNKLVVAWAFPRYHMGVIGVIGTVVTYALGACDPRAVRHNCANNSHIMALGPRPQIILVVFTTSKTTTTIATPFNGRKVYEGNQYC